MHKDIALKITIIFTRELLLFISANNDYASWKKEATLGQLFFAKCNFFTQQICKLNTTEHRVGNWCLIANYRLESPSGKLIKVMKHVNTESYNP